MFVWTKATLNGGRIVLMQLDASVALRKPLQSADPGEIW